MSSSLPTVQSPLDSGFIPRREFIPHPKQLPNSFSLLALSGSNYIRLYSWPQSVVSLFRQFFDQRNAIQAFREDVARNWCEIQLVAGPWASPKSLATERLLVEILGLIYQSGFNFLSSIDYGRESDDRLAIAFSRPAQSELLSPSGGSPIPHSLSGSSPIPDHPRARIPFALSFPSAKVLRVICPPLHSTPAILQAVRGAWPRGVESEKKVGENSFEFKLKGYKWFQEDTFATDSLRYILALLSSLDSQSFTLQASISLTNRTKNKDLWIFTGPPPPEESESSHPSFLNASHPDFQSQQSMGLHKRLATEPVGSPTSLAYAHHSRAATDGVGRRSPQYMQPSPAGSSGSLAASSHNLRKAAPRAQVPVSVHDTDLEMPQPVGYRADLPSTISDGVENMTGVGTSAPPIATPDVFYSTPPLGDPSAVPSYVNMSPEAAALPSMSAEAAALGSPRALVSPLASPRSRTPPLHQSHTPSSSSYPEDGPSTPIEAQEDTLLSPGVFKDSGVYRDSALSSNTDISAEIPIKWTGASEVEPAPVEEKRMSTGMMIPGGWQPTPMEEKTETAAVAPLDLHLEQSMNPERPVQDVRVASPEISPADQLRKSQAGVVDVLRPSTPPPPLPTAIPSSPKGKEREVSSGTGWVFVNIDGKNADPASAAAADASRPPDADVGAPPVTHSLDPSSDSQEKATNSDNPPDESTPGLQAPQPLPPSARSIVIMDAVDAKKGRSKKDSVQQQSRIRRLLSITKRDSPKSGDENADTPGKRPRIRSLKPSKATPEAKRNEDNRRSFD